ncbi:MAG: DUF2399 domain-containing protein [Proteobacteria bacterium]|nr:DUF2399 domain-containing protein [Pseudomonadota bacterium]
MDALARQCLETLFVAGEKSDAGVRVRAPALTTRDLRAYAELRSLQAKESFDTTMRAAEIDGAVVLTWDTRNGTVTRVALGRLEALAAFLGRTTTGTTLQVAREQLAGQTVSHPVLTTVLEQWRLLRKVRGTSVTDTGKWLDAVRVVDHCRSRTQTSDEAIRNVSAEIFNDSKRIEKLSGPLDVLLVGDVESPPREEQQVWRELGLFREDQPMVFAGNLAMRRTRVTGLLDAPYVGYAADAVLSLESRPEMVLSIENQTNFREAARRHCNDPQLRIFSAGMPSPAWCAALGRLLASIDQDVPVYHWGDYDEGGFRIAAHIAKLVEQHGRRLLPWRMDPASIPESRRLPASPKTVRRMRDYAMAACWTEIAAAIEHHPFTTEQEGL